MNNSVRDYVNNFEYQEDYRTLLNELIGDIQNEIEESIKKGEWYKQITYDITAWNDDEQTVDKIMEDLGGEDFNIEGFKIDMEIHDYTLYYYIAIDTDVNDGHLDYNLMDKLLTNDYLENIENVRRYIKVFNQHNTVLSNDDEVIVIDNELKTKVTFFVSDWGRWHHYTKQLEN